MTEIGELLDAGDLEILGRVPHASNTTLVCEVTMGEAPPMQCVYKPVRGEMPLWDFPDGTLAGREVASYLISEALGWGLIPETVLRADGPVGPGMVQRWIDAAEDADEIVDLVPLDGVPADARPILRAFDAADREVVLVHRLNPRVKQLAVLDVVLNNADRKGGHVLVTDTGEIFGIDHGICLHTDDKLRTVLWGWADEPVEQTLLDDVSRVSNELADDSSTLRKALATHITDEEIAAVIRRCDDLVNAGRMPSPPPHHPIPWPPF